MQMKNDDHLIFKTGAVLTIMGTILNIASNSVQPLIRDYMDTAEVFTALANVPLWRASRVGILLAAVFGLGGLLAFARSVRATRGEWIAQIAVLIAAAGSAVVVVMMGLDLAQRNMAELWLQAGPSEAVPALWAGHALHMASFAVFTMTIILLAGANTILTGLAILLSGGYPRWLGWLVFSGGAGALVCGIIQALAGPSDALVNVWLPIFGGVVAISNLGLARYLWRLAGAELAGASRAA